MIKAMQKNKRFIITLFSLLLMLCITAGTTLAWLSTSTGEQSNVFTGAEDIRARLSEPNWDEAKGLALVPGKTVNKDPMITNTGQTEEYVALRLTFLHEEDGAALSQDDLLKLINLIEISWDSKWKLYDGVMTVNASGEVTAITQPLIFYYDESLAAGKISDPIFSSIRVKTKSDGLTEAELRWLQGIKIEDGEVKEDPNGLGGFHLKIEGAAVQSVSFRDALEAAPVLKSLFP